MTTPVVPPEHADGWSPFKDVDGLAVRVLWQAGEIVEIDMKSWKEVPQVPE